MKHGVLATVKGIIGHDAVFVLALFAVGLSSCASDPPKDTGALQLACGETAVSVRALAMLRGDGALSPEAVASVEGYRPVLSAACSGQMNTGAALPLVREINAKLLQTLLGGTK